MGKGGKRGGGGMGERVVDEEGNNGVEEGSKGKVQ